MEDHRLKAFCLVVELKSFSRAARAKHMTQSAMSHLIKNLEREMGARLLHRDGKAVTLTPAGKLFYEHATKILQDYSRLEQALSASALTVNAPVRVGATRTSAVQLLPQALYHFSKEHPEIRIDLTIAKTDEIVRDLREGGIDIGIAEGDISDGRIVAEQIAEDEVVIIASEDHPLAKKKTVSEQDLTTQSLILPPSGSGTRGLVDAFLEGMGTNAERLNVRMTLDSPELIVQMVQTGLGIGFVSKWSVFSAIKEGTVKLLKAPGRKMTRHFSLIGIEREPAAASTKTFKEFITHYRFFAPF